MATLSLYPPPAARGTMLSTSKTLDCQNLHNHCLVFLSQTFPASCAFQIYYYDDAQHEYQALQKVPPDTTFNRSDDLDTKCCTLCTEYIRKYDIHKLLLVVEVAEEAKKDRMVNGFA